MKNGQEIPSGRDGVVVSGSEGIWWAEKNTQHSRCVRQHRAEQVKPLENSPGQSNRIEITSRCIVLALALIVLLRQAQLQAATDELAEVRLPLHCQGFALHNPWMGKEMGYGVESYWFKMVSLI